MVKPIYYRGDSLNDTINETEKKKSRGLEHSKPMSKGGASFNDNINGFEKDVVDLSTRAKVFIKYKNAKIHHTTFLGTYRRMCWFGGGGCRDVVWAL